MDRGGVPLIYIWTQSMMSHHSLLQHIAMRDHEKTVCSFFYSYICLTVKCCITTYFIMDYAIPDMYVATRIVCYCIGDIARNC